MTRRSSATYGNQALYYSSFEKLHNSICFAFLGGLAWIRKSSKFYKSLTKRRDNVAIAFYTPQFTSSTNESISRSVDNLNLRNFTSSFIETINLDQVNYIVEDIPPSKYSNISVGNRIFIEESIRDVAVLGTVIAKETITTYNGSRYNFTVRLDSNSSDIVLEDKNVWLLQSQLGQSGKKICQRLI